MISVSDGVQRTTITVSAPGLPADAKEILVADDERPYQNPREALDVDGDKSVGPLDALLIINIMNSIGTGEAVVIMAQYQGPARFPDASGDNFISPLDALLVVNSLNAQGNVGGEGENLVAPDAPIATWLVEDPLTDPQPDVNRAVALASLLEETLPAFFDRPASHRLPENPTVDRRHQMDRRGIGRAAGGAGSVGSKYSSGLPSLLRRLESHPRAFAGGGNRC